MEMFDVVDEYGVPTGERVERSEAHKNGIRHRSAHIWVIRKVWDEVQVLLQRRAYDKDSFPGKLDTSCAGHMQAGDGPLQSAMRELSEELGIYAKEDDLTFIGSFSVAYEKEFHGSLFKDDEICFVYTYEKPVDEAKLMIQKEEIDSVEWQPLSEVYEKCIAKDEDYCVPLGGLETLTSYLGI